MREVPKPSPWWGTPCLRNHVNENGQTLRAPSGCVECSRERALAQKQKPGHLERRRELYRERRKDPEVVARNRATGRESARKTGRARRYGLSPSELAELYERAGNACELCGTPESDLPRKLNIDHDHSCCPVKAWSCGKCVRGLLCHRCNTMATLYDLVGLERLRAYIARSA